MRTLKLLTIFLICTTLICVQVKGQREELSLKKLPWKIWLDENAEWKNDALFLPNDVNIKFLPSNPPTCGWENLYSNKGIDCKIPATIEEYFSKGDPFYTYHGVAWFWTSVNIPQNWKGKTINIYFTSTRLRCELYVNNKLSGYDIVAETPWQVDISKNLMPGRKNKIALRITNPGGFRGWEDFPSFKWGKYEFPASHDFGGIGGDIVLRATTQKYIKDVFVENMLPARSKKIKVNIVLNKLNEENQNILPLSLNIGIVSHSNGKIIFSEDYFLKPQNDSLKIELTVPEAELWEINNPLLYECKINLKGKVVNDNYTVLFGFRTFEVKEINNDTHFYFNGKRMVHISSIDWGYYSGTGLYPTQLMAEKSVLAAKSIGHNGINCHRNLGNIELLKQANEKGLYIYEEPGGFHAGQQGYNVMDSTFAGEYMIEKCCRMAIRDRNNPCLIIYNLCNEDNYWTPLREKCMKIIHNLNPTVMVSNSSGGYFFDIFQMAPSNYVNHIRPYENLITDKYEDNHTVEEYKGIFYEPFLFSHAYETKNLQYWGEVHCYAGPDNWYKSAEELDQKWGANYFLPLHDKIFSFFKDCNLSSSGSRVINSPEDVSLQAGRGLMYINGRAVQNLISRNNVDGFAINGWSGTTEVVPGEGGYWSSSILDGNRNIKGVASDYAYWTKPLQICIKRMNGIIFNPSEIAIFEIRLVNQNKLTSGNYILKLKIKDGMGEYVPYSSEQVITVIGGDVFAQHICNLPIKLGNWRGGYITLEAKLFDEKNKEVAMGTEQILLNNRLSFSKQFSTYTGSVINWEEASRALKDAKVPVPNFDPAIGKQSFICAGRLLPSPKIIDNILKRVKEDGTTLLLNFNEKWARILYDKKIIAEVPKFEVVKIEGSWAGNGWGYLDYFIGNQAIPSKSTIGINSWELGMQSQNHDQEGFYPLLTTNPNCKTRAYGAYFARPAKLLILLGEIEYGKGRILLNSSYQVDQKHPICDLMFYNMLTMDNQVKVKEEMQELPFRGEPISIPGIVPMVDYNLGGEGIAYHDTDEINQGKEYRTDGVDIGAQSGNFFVGWIDSGEWLNFEVDVKKAGTYRVEFEYATPNNATLLLIFDGVNKGGEIKLPSTGDWFAFRQYSILLNLEAGIQILKVFFKEGGCNISQIKFNYHE